VYSSVCASFWEYQEHITDIEMCFPGTKAVDANLSERQVQEKLKHAVLGKLVAN